ncbi:MAG: hypothetical protein WC495_02145 [Patescibacteria group bacterium]|jgi:hypothetical protein
MSEEIPKINKRAFCVTRDVELGATISCYFNNKNEYFPIFYFPSVEKGDNSQFARLVTSRAQILIINRYVLFKPDFIIFAGLNEFQQSFFNKIRDEKKIIINYIQEVSSKLSFLNKNFNGEVKCNKYGILEALHIAKKENKKIVIDNSAPRILAKEGDGNGLIVIEKELEISNVNAINYAQSINAEIRLIKKVRRDEVDIIYKQLNQWGKAKDSKVKERVIQKLKKRISKPIPNQYKYITFFTNGLPYHLTIDSSIPCSYVWTHAADLMVFDNIFIEEFKKPIRNSCVLFSPENFEIEETRDVKILFENNNFLVKAITGDDATIQNFDNYSGYFPYDILHICSHGGETEGHYVIKKFEDRNGNLHTVEYYEIHSFYLTGEKDKRGEPMVAVVTKAIFEKLDGIKWASSRLRRKNYSQLVYEDMWKAVKQAPKKEQNTIRVKTAYPIPTSTHIQCSNGDHQGQFHSLASMGTPIIFNNTCSSGYYIAYGLISAGARAYIGTLWNVNNKNAANSSKKLYQLCLEKNFTLTMAVNQINRDLENTKDASIYILWGLHFSCINKPDNSAQDQTRIQLIKELETSFVSYFRKIQDPDMEKEVKINSIRILRFIISMVKNDLQMTTAIKEADIKEITSVKYDPEIKKWESDRFSSKDSITYTPK